MAGYADVSADDLKVFLQEAETLIESLDEHIVRLEQEGAQDELIQEIFRVAHTLKGSSGMLGFEDMAHLTHAMEDLLDRVRRGTLAVSESMIDALLMSLDGLKVMKDNLSTGTDAEVDVSAAVAALQQAAESGDAPAAVTTRSLAATVGAEPALLERAGAVAAAGRALLRVTATVAHESEWTAVRCFQVLNELDRLGEVLGSAPSQPEIEAEQVADHIDVLFAFTADPDEAGVRDALGAIDDVVSVEVAAFDLAEATAAAAGATPAAPAAPKEVHATQPQRVEALQSTVRIDVAQLDALMNMVGELVIDRTRVSQLSRMLGERFNDDEQVRSLSETSNHIEKIVDELHERMMQVRMLPVGMLFSKFPRLVRDLSRSLGKSIRLEMEGEDTEIDRSVIEQIKDPLVHLIRNACDHGIEAPETRAEAGKPELSVLHLAAMHSQGQIVITLTDDGNGIDADRVKAKAIERGLLTTEKAERLSHKEAVELIFEPGLSTAAATTEVSGRGVGMDIVRRDIESLGGRIEVETQRGQGTTFRLHLPLTLATLGGLLVGCGRATYAVPLIYVQETLRPESMQMQTIGGRPVLHLRTRDTVMPLKRLDDLLGARDDDAMASRDNPYVVVVRASENESDAPVAIAVDRLIDQQDIVVKSLSPFLGRKRGVAGASILGDGQVVLILDIPSLIKSSQHAEHPAVAEEPALERIAS